jgi:hypothetical protein
MAHLQIKWQHWPLIVGSTLLICTMIGIATWMTPTQSPHQVSPSLLMAGAMLRSTPPDLLAGGNRVDAQWNTISRDIVGEANSALAIADTALDTQAQINAQQCYTDPQAQNVATQAINANDGRLVFSLNYCPNQQALFGRLSLLETAHPLTAGGCFYIQNQQIFSGPGGFEGNCFPQIDPGTIQTTPATNDGQQWQACWIDYSVMLPKPLCTAFQRSI